MKLNMPGKLQTPTVSANRKDVPALLKTQWSQEAPYSNDCPSGTVTGMFYASKAYVAYKTMNILIHKSAIPADIAKKLGL